MTDPQDGQPLTRRERRERERAAELAAAEAAERESANAPAAEAPAAEAAPAQEAAEAPVAEAAPVAESAGTEATASSAPGARDAVDEELAPTQAADLSELFGTANDSAKARPAATEPSPQQAEASRRIGRFFGRKHEVDEPAIADSSEDRPASVPAPARANPSSVPLDDIQDLDVVDDAEVDVVEIDEVQVEATPVSALRISTATPAELEDHRVIEAEPVDETEQQGPVRHAGRIPVIVNVVQDTSEHHISELRTETDSIERQNVGTGSTSITANALVLPMTGTEDQIAFEAPDGVLVTGSIDLPDGFASSGRGRGSFDGADLDNAFDSSEVQNPETQPVRASSAVSSYANARVRIAPQKHSTRALPVGLAIGGAVVAAGAIATMVIGFALNWF